MRDYPRWNVYLDLTSLILLFVLVVASSLRAYFMLFGIVRSDIVCASASIESYGYVVYCEALAVKTAVIFALRMKYGEVIIESDSKLIVDMCVGTMDAFWHLDGHEGAQHCISWFLRGPASVGRNKDPSLEREALAGTAAVEHAGLPGLSGGRIKSASAVLLHSLALLPRAAQRHLRPWQLILCLGSLDRAVNSALVVYLGLRLVHVDANCVEEIADTIMALFLGLLRRTHLLSRHSSSSSAASGWLGSVQPLCRGMRRCRGLMLGIIGRSVSAQCLATRSLAFKILARCVLISEGEQVD
ncbi:hypothetical protein Cni_G13208 [Canna indica]|uniref:RNase H type-1 domain-containing protein n=1 Tax=Canna indica TaxID=4628 RepID=A0AAQ3KDJ1_9LILI|nr:hypothetical protein Cni_G13208 [Canna indica]